MFAIKKLKITIICLDDAITDPILQMYLHKFFKTCHTINLFKHYSEVSMHSTNIYHLNFTILMVYALSVNMSSVSSQPQRRSWFHPHSPRSPSSRMWMRDPRWPSQLRSSPYPNLTWVNFVQIFLLPVMSYKFIKWKFKSSHFAEMAIGVFLLWFWP